MKVNTESRMKPNSLGPIPEPHSASRDLISTGHGAGQHNGTQPPQEREDRLPARRLSVRKTKEVLRLRFEVGLTCRDLSRQYAGKPSLQLFVTSPQRAGILKPDSGWSQARWLRNPR